MRKAIILLFALAIGLTAMAQLEVPQAREVNTWLEKELPGNIIQLRGYDEKGKLAQTGFLKNGEKHGTWIQYSISGKKMAYAQFQMGERDGKWHVYTNDGDLQYVIEYDEGQRTAATEYDAEGAIVASR